MTLTAATTTAARRTSRAPRWYLDAKPVKNDWTWYLWLPLWWLYGTLRLYKIEWVPLPYYWGSVARATRYFNQAIRDMQASLYGVVSVVADKGGVGKSTHSTWLMAILALASGNPTLFIDTDSGSEGDSASRCGIDLSQTKYTLNHVIPLALNSKWQPDMPQLCHYLPRHKQSGAFILAPSEKLTTTAYQMQQVIRTFRKPLNLVILDSTPGVKEQNNESLHREATVSVLSALDKEPSYSRHIPKFRKHMNGDHENAFDNGIRSGKQFIVIGDVPLHRFNLRYRHELAQRLSVPVQQLILLPRDKHVKDEGDVDITRVSSLFLYAITLFAYQVAVAVEHHNQSHPVEEPALNSRSVSEKILKNDTRKLLAKAGGSNELAHIIELIEEEDARPSYTT